MHLLEIWNIISWGANCWDCGPWFESGITKATRRELFGVTKTMIKRNNKNLRSDQVNVLFHFSSEIVYNSRICSLAPTVYIYARTNVIPRIAGVMPLLSPWITSLLKQRDSSPARILVSSSVLGWPLFSFLPCITLYVSLSIKIQRYQMFLFRHFKLWTVNTHLRWKTN